MKAYSGLNVFADHQNRSLDMLTEAHRDFPRPFTNSIKLVCVCFRAAIVPVRIVVHESSDLSSSARLFRRPYIEQASQPTRPMHPSVWIPPYTFR